MRCMQTSKGCENVLVIVAGNTDAIIADDNMPHRGFELAVEGHNGWVVTTEFQGVAEKVLKQL